MEERQTFDVCLAYDWEYDTDFIMIIAEKAVSSSLSTFMIGPSDIEIATADFKAGRLRFRTLFDRGSDSTESFLRLNTLVQNNGVRIFEPIENTRWADDKATMHLEFIANGINTPYSIIIPPYGENNNIFISVTDLAKLGRPFIIKPANTSGGGIGVVQGAETLMDVLEARKFYKNDKYLLQEMIRPKIRDGKIFWFRGFYACGHIEFTWWDPDTHYYSSLADTETSAYGLESLFAIIKRIGEICRLRFFSTEIVFTEKEEFIVVDYVNVTSDMRLQSVHRDGVPDEVVHRIAAVIVSDLGEY